MPITPDCNEELPSEGDAFSRTGVTDIFGKLDDHLPEIRMNGDVVDQMRRNARAIGMNLTEYARYKIYVGEYGFEHVNSLREKQLRRAMGIAPSMQGIGGLK